MAGRVAIDFGTSFTRAAIWNESAGRAEPLVIPDISITKRYIDETGKENHSSSIPSLIHYDGNQILVGKQVIDHGRVEDQLATFRWMKRYISNRLELPRQVNGRTIKFSEAGSEFLARVLDFVSLSVGQEDLSDEEIAFTVPVESYEDYQEWLCNVCEAAGIRRYRLLDEASAAALGYGVSIQANDVYMVFDFGGGTLDVSIVRIEGEVTSGKRCRVLGKAGCEIGGTDIDKWMYQDVLKRTGKNPDDVRHISSLLLLEAERVKESLTVSDSADITVVDSNTGAVISVRYTRSQFEDLLENRGMFSTIQSVIDRALRDASEKGFERDHIKEVLLVGGSSLIPCVRRSVRQTFGDRVRHYRPMEAVSLGGAAFVGGVDFYDHIQHDYALKAYNPAKKVYEYKIIVQAGTTYPSKGPVAEKTVSASTDRQARLGLAIYELGRKQSVACGPVDLVWDHNGCARFTKRQDAEIISQFCVNEKCPTFIHAQPPADKGEKRFPVQFTIDGNKRLCVTVMDNRTGKPLMKDHPVIKLR